MFTIGQEVVCIDADFEDDAMDRLLVKDRHYIIRGHITFLGIPCVRVEGIVRPAPLDLRGLFSQLDIASDPLYKDLLDDMPYRATRFAPIVKNKSSTEVMEQLFGGLRVEKKIKTPEFA